MINFIPDGYLKAGQAAEIVREKYGLLVGEIRAEAKTRRAFSVRMKMRNDGKGSLISGEFSDGRIIDFRVRKVFPDGCCELRREGGDHFWPHETFVLFGPEQLAYEKLVSLLFHGKLSAEYYSSSKRRRLKSDFWMSDAAGRAIHTGVYSMPDHVNLTTHEKALLFNEADLLDAIECDRAKLTGELKSDPTVTRQGDVQKASAGRPRKAEKAAASYRKLFPDGHEAQGFTTSQVESRVRADIGDDKVTWETIRRGLKA